MAEHEPKQIESLPVPSDRNWRYMLLVAGSQAGMPGTAAGMDVLVDAYDALEKSPLAITLARTMGEYLFEDARRDIDT